MSNSFAFSLRPLRGEIGRTANASLLLLGLLMSASALAGAPPKNPPSKPKVTQPAPAASKLILEVSEVRCKDETGTEPQEWVGGDEIAIAAVTVDTRGKVEYAPRWTVGKFEKDGSVKNKFAKDGKGKPKKGPYPIASFPLQSEFPARYEVVLVLAELDQGTGLERFAKELVKRGGKVAADSKKGGGVDNKVLKAGAKAGAKVAASTAAGAAVGGPVGAGALGAGTIAAEIGKALMGDAKAMLKEIWGDDIFSAHSVSAHFKAADFSPTFKKGAKATKPQTATVKGADGTYQITYAWRLAK